MTQTKTPCFLTLFFKLLTGGMLLCIVHQNLADTPKQQEAVVSGRALMASGAELMMQADRLQQAARDALSQSQNLRKFSQRLPRQGSNNQTETTFKSNWLDSSTALQKLGVQLRQQAEQVSAESLFILAQGFQTIFNNQIEHKAPLALYAEQKDRSVKLSAHNSMARSVHPNMTKRVQPPATRQAEDMSLELTSLAQQQLPPRLDLDTFQLSRNRSYFAHIELEKDEKTGHAVVLNKMHVWRLMLSTTNGMPVQGAKVSFEGTMPGHVHGLPTQPRVTAGSEPGLYQISGVKFQMSGWWVIDLIVEPNPPHSDERDIIRFNLLL